MIRIIRAFQVSICLACRQNNFLLGVSHTPFSIARAIPTMLPRLLSSRAILRTRLPNGKNLVPRSTLVAAPKPGDGPLMSRRADRELPGMPPLAKMSSALSDQTQRYPSKWHALDAHISNLPRRPDIVHTRNLQLPEILFLRGILDNVCVTDLTKSSSIPRRRNLLCA